MRRMSSALAPTSIPCFTNRLYGTAEPLSAISAQYAARARERFALDAADYVASIFGMAPQSAPIVAVRVRRLASEERRGPGRPPLADVAATEWLKVRVTPDQKRRLDRGAEKLGTSASVLVRQWIDVLLTPAERTVGPGAVLTDDEENFLALVVREGPATARRLRDLSHTDPKRLERALDGLLSKG